jgi:hypothetical protein
MGCPIAKFLEDALEWEGICGHRVYVTSRRIYLQRLEFGSGDALEVELVAIFTPPEWVRRFVLYLSGFHYKTLVDAKQVLRILSDVLADIEQVGSVHE